MKNNFPSGKDVETTASQNTYYQNILQTIMDGYWLLDVHGKILDVNESYCNMVGYSREELLTFHIADLDRNEDLHTTEQRIQRIIKNGSEIFTSTHYKKNGSPVEVEVSVTYVDADTGRFICICRNITQRRRIEDELRESKAALEKAQRVAHVGSWSWDIRTNHLTWSKEMYHIFGIDPDQFSGSLPDVIASAIHPDDREIVEKSNRAVIENGKPYPVEYRIIRPDQSVRVVWGEAGELVTDEQGNPRMLSGIVQDNTERKQAEEALRFNNELFSQFMRHSPVYIYIKEVTPTVSRVLEASDNFVDMIGVAGQDMIGKTMQELFPTAFAEKITADDWAVVSGGEVYQEEETLNDRTYTTIKFPIKEGEKHLLAGYTIDITDQKNAEKALRESEEHFRSIVDNSEAGYFFIDKDGIIRDVNSAWARLYRYDSADEIIGHHFAEIQNIEDVEAANEFVNGIMQNDSHYLRGEFSRKCKDGSTGYHTFSARPVVKNGEVIGIEGFIIDSTEYRQTVEALRRSEERYHLIDEASQDMIYSYDRDSRFTHANTYLCRQLQLTPEQIIGKTHEELGYPQELCDEWAALNQQVYETDTTVIAETTSIMPDGKRKFFEVVLNPMHDAEGNIIGIAGTTRDIHERKKAEAQIKQQINELNRWHEITMGREQRILELKQEVNKLLGKLHQPPKYGSVNEG